MTTNKQIIEGLKKFHSRYHNKFKSGKVFWEEYYKELNRLLQEKDGWTKDEIDMASFNSYLKSTYGIHGETHYGCKNKAQKTYCI